jgi:tellurite resistance protein TerC
VFESVGSPQLWAAFLLGVLFMLALDLGVFHRKAHSVSTKEALAWSIVWVVLSLAFNGLVYHWFGTERALEFLSAYVIEKSLSVDNLFVFVVIFRYMGVRAHVMHRVLVAGILGALILRGVFIIVGLGLIELFSWTLYAFGAFLLFTGIRLLFAGDEHVDPSENFAYRIARKFLPLTRGYVGNRFFAVEQGLLRATPLFIVLLMIETSDVVFALDSIPAVFGISRDPFIVFTSNVCAVLGLRAMFFLLQNVLDRFAYLKYGLGLVLAFIGAKMIVAEGVFGFELHIETSTSLAIVAGLISVSMVASAFAPASAQHLIDDGKESSMIAEMEEGAAIEHTLEVERKTVEKADDGQ